MNSKAELLLFDLDGTLVDSKLDIVQSVNRAFSSLGMPLMPETVIGDGIGHGSERLFQKILGAEAGSVVVERALSAFKAIYPKHLTENTRLYPDIATVLAHYAATPKVVVTNKSQAQADAIIDGLGLRTFFEGVFGFEAFTTQKPDPGPLLEICARWKVSAAKAVMVGDSAVDVTAGKRAGARTVAVLYGYGAKSELKSSAPDVEVERALELIGLL